MSIGVHVREYTGEIVAGLDGPVDVNGLCDRAAEDPGRYPLLSGVDELDDTYFNARQGLRLARELEALAAAGGGVEAAARAVLRLAGLLQPAPKRPHHRLLVFVGD